MPEMTTMTKNNVLTARDNKLIHKIAEKILPYFGGICTFRNPIDHAFLKISCGNYTAYKAKIMLIQAVH